MANPRDTITVDLGPGQEPRLVDRPGCSIEEHARAERRARIDSKVAELRAIEQRGYGDQDIYVGGMVDAADLGAALALVDELMKAGL